MRHVIPQEGVKWQLRSVELVGKVVEGFLEEGRFEVRTEGRARVTGAGGGGSTFWC